MRQAPKTTLANWLALVTYLVTGTICLAEDFTFKKIKVGSGKMSLVQIDPVAQAKALAALPTNKAKTDAEPAAPAPATAAVTGLAQPGLLKSSAKYAWFWDQVSPSRDQASGRFAKAMAQLSLGPAGSSVVSPRSQQMQNLASSYGTEILKATIGTQVSPALVLAVIGIESAGETAAESAAGAQGLMQLMPATAARFGVSDAKDPVQNIKGGVAYLDFLMKTFDRDPLMVIAAYNAGEGAVAANSGVPPFAETRDYVPKVLAAWQVAQGLCLTPPELMTDPCVFKIISASN